jgi:hypothetical protein
VTHVPLEGRLKVLPPQLVGARWSVRPSWWFVDPWPITGENSEQLKCFFQNRRCEVSDFGRSSANQKSVPMLPLV